MIEINHFIHNVLERCGVDKKPNVETIIQEIYNNEKMEIKDFIELSDDAEKCHKLINETVLSRLILSDAEIDCLMEIDNICVYLYKDFVNYDVDEKKLEFFSRKIITLNTLSEKLSKYASNRIHKKH